MEILSKCAWKFGSEFLKCQTGMQKCGDITLVQLAVMKDPSVVKSGIKSNLLGTDDFIAAVIVGRLNNNKSDGAVAVDFLKSCHLNPQRKEDLQKHALYLDGSKLRFFTSLSSQRESVEIAISPGPFDAIIYGKRVDKRRCTYLKHANQSVFEYNNGIHGFMRNLMRLGCRKTDFPATVWDAFWEKMQPDEQAAFAASVLLHPTTETVEETCCNLWHDLPRSVTMAFKDCSTYQCGICYSLPMQVYNCIEGCRFYCCHECRRCMDVLCPMCRANQKGIRGSRSRPAEVRAMHI